MTDEEERMRPRSGGSRVVGAPPKAKPVIAPKPAGESGSKIKKEGEGDK